MYWEVLYQENISALMIQCWMQVFLEKQDRSTDSMICHGYNLSFSFYLVQCLNKKLFSCWWI